MKPFTKLVTASAMALGLAAPAAAQDDDPLQVSFVYVGSIGDMGWTFSHDHARQQLEEHFGDAVETTYAENVPEGADAERVLTQMALSGADLIFTTSFGYMDPTNAVAERFPNVMFEHATGYSRDHPNVSTYSARFYEGRAVMGHIAGQMTESNIVGYIGSYPIPEVIRGINSAYLHAREVNPDIEFRIVWAYTWFDPAVEADAAQALIDEGADVIMQHTDSPAPVRIAEDKGVYAFGQASDMLEFGPNARLSSIIDNWAPYYIRRVQAALDGTWESTDTWDGIAEGMTEIGGFNAVLPFEVRKEAMDAAIAIAGGRLHPFTGPIDRQDGTPWLAEGETADDGTLLGMNFYVEGIEGQLPQ